MCTGLVNSSTSLGCSLSFSQQLVTMCVRWYAYHITEQNIFCMFKQIHCFLRFGKVVHDSLIRICLLMQMTVLTVYVFLYGRAYLVMLQNLSLTKL